MTEVTLGNVSFQRCMLPDSNFNDPYGGNGSLGLRRYVFLSMEGSTPGEH